MENRAGTFTSKLYGEMAYRSFIPSPLPPNPAVITDDEMMQLLVQAHTWIAKLESIAPLIPHIALFVSMYVRKEALMSSHCTWWLPYRSLVKRLWEIKTITKIQYQALYAVE